VSPTHYTGEVSHVSDTENTQVIESQDFELDLSELKTVGSDSTPAQKDKMLFDNFAQQKNSVAHFDL
jgi:hypothetical protein